MFVEETAKFKVHCHRKHGTMESPLPITTSRGFPSELGSESPEMLRLSSLFTQRPQSQFQQSSKFADQINVDVSIRRVKLSGTLVILMYMCNQTNGHYCCCSDSCFVCKAAQNKKGLGFQSLFQVSTQVTPKYVIFIR